MVVRMRMGTSVRGALSYNEQKVIQGKAEFLLAYGFGTEISNLGFTEKLNRFQALNERREHAKTNTVHLSLNFPPGEELSEETLRMLAVDYMTRIGFGEQPFLVYKHMDANHPHIHIVTSSIRPNGKPIQLHKIGERLSEPARKELEVEYGLITAESRKKDLLMLPGETMAPAEYGEAAVKAHITNIVGQVVRSYKFASFDEFNAILRQFNVVADRGPVGSAMYNNGGLVYSFINAAGSKVGVSIKSGNINKEVTLKRINQKYALNGVSKARAKASVKDKVDRVLLKHGNAARFLENLSRSKVRLSFDKNPSGEIKAVHFVDHFSRSVFSNTELGIPLETLVAKLRPKPESPGEARKMVEAPISAELKKDFENVLYQLFGDFAQNMSAILLKPEMGQPGPSADIPKKKKKKKKRL